jgi:murein DD-endopeptidase MepM/ murein hydrolase activator NlpD
MRTFVLAGAVATLLLPGPPGPPAPEPAPPTPTANPADYFQAPLPTWEPHCLGFGSEWRICNGTVLRACPSGAVWLHTGADIQTGIQPVMAAGDGVIIGYLVDPTFRGGVLIKHPTSEGVVITQYWHVWLRPGFGVGTPVTRGQAFADIADMGQQTHLHFAVYRGDYEQHAWNGALPPTSCSGFPAFPFNFVEPTAFLKLHLEPAVPVHKRGK